jgi:hypothetical protein
MAGLETAPCFLSLALANEPEFEHSALPDRRRITSKVLRANDISRPCGAKAAIGCRQSVVW